MVQGKLAIGSTNLVLAVLYAMFIQREQAFFFAEGEETSESASLNTLIVQPQPPTQSSLPMDWGIKVTHKQLSDPAFRQFLSDQYLAFQASKLLKGHSSRRRGHYSCTVES